MAQSEGHDAPWLIDELVTHPPQIEAGHLIVADRPGWGTEPNEDALAAHPPKPYAGLDFRKTS